MDFSQNDCAQERLKVGLVHNWPGAKNSELDIIIRVIDILESLKYRWVIIDPMGFQLDKKGDRIGDNKPKNIDFVLNFHYTNPKFLPMLSYVVNWNPIAYILDSPITKKPLSIKQLNYLVDCLRSHDRFLSAGSEIVNSYAEAALTGNTSRPWLEETLLNLHTTISSLEEKNNSFPPESGDRAKVFYIGANWEKTSTDINSKVRHEGLFETLDKSGQFRFYGLRKLYGTYLWEGIDSYKGELPFDGGKSINEKSISCGISLVLHSEQHRGSALVSTRIFQACKSGTVIISDRNDFVERHFGDSVYFFEYGDSAIETGQNILTVVSEIQSNWAQAQVKAKQAKAIFQKKFALEEEIKSICVQANKDISRYQSYLNKLESYKVSIVYSIKSYNSEALEQFLTNLSKQIHKNIEAHIYCSRLDKLKVDDYIAKQSYKISLNVMESTNLNIGFCLNQTDLDEDVFLVVYSQKFEWRADHISLLLSVSIENGKCISYSPLFESNNNYLLQPETMEYFIKGLNGGFNQLNFEQLKQLDFEGVPLGNIMLFNWKKYLNSNYKEYLNQFDIFAVYLIALESQLSDISIKSTNALTSIFQLPSTQNMWLYDEYAQYADLTSYYKQRDRNALVAFGRYCLSNEVQDSIEEKLIVWESQQKSGNLYSTSKYICSYPVGNQFQLINTKLKHILRNRPLVYKFMSKVFSAIKSISRF